MKIAAVTILYNPDSRLVERIKSYAPYVSKLYLIDNSDKYPFSIDKLNIENLSIEYIRNQQNDGIAKPLNVIAKLALHEGFNWLLTMDQDSSFGEEEFEKYVNCISQYRAINYVAMFGVEYDKKKFITEGNCTFIQVNYLITSGSILNLELYKFTMGFDESLFIDQVDHEYCFQSKLKGFRIVKLCNILLNHSLGSVSTHRSLKNFKNTQRTLHSASRIYYMIRNYFYLKEKYAQDFSFELNEIRKSLMNSIKNNLIYNQQRGLVIKYLFKAFKDFRKGKMGKLS